MTLRINCEDVFVNSNRSVLQSGQIKYRRAAFDERVELVYYSLREQVNVLGVSLNYVAWYTEIKSYSFSII